MVGLGSSDSRVVVSSPSFLPSPPSLLPPPPPSSVVDTFGGSDVGRVPIEGGLFVMGTPYRDSERGKKSKNEFVFR